MQIVVKVPDDMIKSIEQGSFGAKYNTYDLVGFLMNGTPLPKGHGRLIDADEFEELFGEKCVGDCGACMPKRKTDGRGRWYDTCLLIDTASTIIEADTESEE